MEAKYLDALKGVPRAIAFYRGPFQFIQLLTYPDGSWGISRNQNTYCVWEPSEAAEAVATFCDLVRVDRKRARRAIRSICGQTILN